MFQKRLGGSPDGSPVDMTPLIDVSLVLVVILLLATPLAFETTLGLSRQDRTGREAPVEGDAPRVELRVVSDDVVVVNDDPVAIDTLGVALAPIFARGALPAVVSCAGEVSHGTFVHVLDTAKRSGALALAITED